MGLHFLPHSIHHLELILNSVLFHDYQASAMAVPLAKFCAPKSSDHFQLYIHDLRVRVL